MNVFEWSIICLLAYRSYKRLVVKPKVWKVILAILVGLFSFTINMEWFNTLVKIPILPLGVWILYGVLNRKEDRWDTYRLFAWIGFLGNFIFLAGTLISIPVYSMIYSLNDPSTYITDDKEASVISIHPEGEDVVLDKKRLMKQLPSMKQEEIEGGRWYEEMYLKSDSSTNRNELFPYQLVGTSSKWGSGLDPVIYMERDGKGLLFTTSRNQYYFRYHDSVIEEAGR